MLPCSLDFRAAFFGLSGIGNTTVYKTKPVLIGLGLGRFPQFLTLVFNGIHYYFLFLTKLRTFRHIYCCQGRPMIAAFALMGSLQHSNFCSYVTSCYCYTHSNCLLSFIHGELAFLIDMYGVCKLWLHTNDYPNAVRLGDASWYLWPDYLS